ncbi:hypothetical protein SAMN04488109_6620 [Chryseolinea serpens]|uniref:Uncharacterized protein n=1 Tax=Chryseolinea serpens TaxID=947013 RepID=A0A1M5XJ13_9BACT|nr:hypothetical protein [Chryseolinea serpens]SHH99801.1 hypothetical protein SAMN04488109_6620 [Chryseolinea serpens]
MKVKSTIYKGIEYVQINALPKEQMDSLMKTINRELLIKILIDDKLVGNCLQFKDYESWFDLVYASEKPAATKAVKEKEKALEAEPVSL